MKRFAKCICILLTLALLCVSVPVSAADTSDAPLNVVVQNFGGTFSPFFYSLASDESVVALTGAPLLAYDRGGMMVLHGAEGETIPYNGTNYTYYSLANVEITSYAQDDPAGHVGAAQPDDAVTYTFTLRDDVTFSDGTPLTADDVIFSMYVLCDPMYDGVSTFFTLPIEGIEAYRTGMDSRMNLILQAGREGYEETPFFTEAQYNAFWEAFDKAGADFVAGIKQYLIDSGWCTPEDPVCVWAPDWGYTMEEGSTEKDLWDTIAMRYEYNLDEINWEKGNSDNITDLILGYLDNGEAYTATVRTGDSAESITGIMKLDDRTVRVKLTEFSATAIYQFGLYVAPMHYYGDPAKYDYDNNRFGFDKGDLSSVHMKDGAPLGAGPYCFESYENGVVTLKANENCYLGAPVTETVRLIDYKGDPMVALEDGDADIAKPAFVPLTVFALREANGLPADSDTLSGSVFTAFTTANLGYGYIGVNASKVCVNNDPGSDASKALRKAIATVIAVYREEGISAYYGDRAEVLEYPISTTSWASPQPADEGYVKAFSVGADGVPIYTDGMTEEQKEAAALTAALGYFEAAGYTVTNGKITAAPENAPMGCEVLIPADGTGDHPAFQIARLAAEALASIGFEFTVTDLKNSSELWERMYANEIELWAAAWGSAVDPDMYQIYFSGDETHEPGASNDYHINDQELNRLILAARSTSDQNARKEMYKQCLDIIADWAVEIPVYQRQNVVVFSTERVDMTSVPADITAYYGWEMILHLVRVTKTAINTDTAKEVNGNLYLAPEQTAADILTLAGEGATLEDKNGKPLAAGDKIGSGAVLKKADGSQETVIVKGDNDGDAAVTAADARFALRVAVELENPNAWETQASLVSGGTNVTAADARAILRAAVGLEDLDLV